MSTINEILKDILDLSEDELNNENTSLNDIESWDSMTHIVLITKLEDEYKLRFTNEEIVEMNTIGKIKDKIKSNI